MQLLRAANINFAYTDRPALRNVALSLNAGEVVALFGPNGSGKSTLIKVLLGHLRAAGEITWNDRIIAEWKPRELARLVSYLPQTPTYDAGQTVADVLRIGRMPYWGAFGIESLRDAQVVEQVADQLELRDILHRSIDQISGGQRQRVFLGRCLAQEPKALLLDEPSTFLDLRHQLDLHQLLRKLAREKNIAVLMASHDLNLTAMHADRAILMHEGEIVAAGTPNDVLQPELLQTVYGVGMRRVLIDDVAHVVPHSPFR